MPDRNMLRLDLIFLKKSKQAAAAAVGVEDRSELKKKFSSKGCMTGVVLVMDFSSSPPQNLLLPKK